MSLGPSAKMSEAKDYHLQATPVTPTKAATSSVLADTSETATEEEEQRRDGSEIVNVPSPAPNAPASPSPKKPSKRTTVEELRSALGELGLDVKGKKDSLYKRLLKAFYKSEDPEAESAEQSPGDLKLREEEVYQERLGSAQEAWKSFLCFDVEATCRGGREYDWPNEVIEFPVVLLQWTHDLLSGTKTLKRVDTFHTYVRPTWQPILTEFCTALTGITQEMVDRSPTFPEMVKLLEMWMDKHDLRDEDGRLKDAVWVTDGPWDLRDFIPKQLHITPTDPPFPPYFFGQYLNIKQATQTVLSEFWYESQSVKASETLNADSVSSTKSKSESGEAKGETQRRDTAPEPSAPSSVIPSRVISTYKTMTKQHREGKWKGPNYYFPIPGQLQALGLGEFEGRQHSGLDDATNISRILIAISQRPKVLIEPNARTPSEKHMKKYPWMGAKPGQVNFEEWMSNTKAVVHEGKSYGGSEQGEGGNEDKQMEWVLREDAAGRFVCVKVEVGLEQTSKKQSEVSGREIKEKV